MGMKERVKKVWEFKNEIYKKGRDRMPGRINSGRTENFNNHVAGPDKADSTPVYEG